ncbi:MAG: type II toxin-antitoxin system VapC family toxin [Chloroflexota bacterium]|nr:type II toxin-antitoxin system VapC family toxin [Chloroflexota bacterium]
MSDSLPVYILDSFAVLAYLEEEAGMEQVKAVLREATTGDCQVYVSLINLGEIVYIIEREQSLQKAQETLAALEQLPIQFLPASRQAILGAAHIKAQYPVAYADAFAIDAAISQNGTVLTGDPEFETVEHLVNVSWLR